MILCFCSIPTNIIIFYNKQLTDQIMFFIIGLLHFILLTLFAIGSCAIDIPNKNNDKKTNKKFPYSGKKWIVLVAGSKGWINYRHQVIQYKL